MTPNTECGCGHARTVHEHYRRGNDCSICGVEGCSRFQARCESDRTTRRYADVETADDDAELLHLVLAQGEPESSRPYLHLVR